jgi:hypothetical protein
MLNVDKVGQIAELQQRAYTFANMLYVWGKYKAKAMLDKPWVQQIYWQYLISMP